jgi:hypothetical protein
MMLFRVIAALWLLLIPVQAAEQSSYVWPVTPVTGGAGANSLGSLTANYYNPALRALASCNFGSVAPANGPSGAPIVGQCWMDVSGSPSFALRYWDGAAWATLATLDSTSHAWVIASGSSTRNVSGTSDSFVDADRGKLVDVCNASGVAHTLPQPGAGGAFVAGWYVTLRNSCVGTDTVSPTLALIDGASSIPVRAGQSVVIRSDGTNYKTTLPQQPWNANLAGIAGLTTAVDKCEYWTGAGTPALMDCLSWARAVTSSASASAGRSAFGLAIGSDVQAYNANLTALAGLTGASGKVPYFTGPAALAMFDSTAFGRSVSNVADAAALRALAGAVIGSNVQAWDADLDCVAAISTTGLISRTGAGTCAVRTITGTANQITVTNGDGVAGAPTISIPSSAALPGAPTTTTAAAGDNSTKIATTAYADAIAALKANIASPTFTGTPAAPTPAVDTSTTQLATTAYVIGQASAVGDGIPAMDGTAGRGTGTHFARNDHIHPSDTSRAPLASPTFTGTPAAPTAAPSNNSTQIATTAYVDAQVAGGVAGVVSLNGQTGILKSTIVPQGRLTLQSGVPVMGTTQSAKTTIYYSAYLGDQVPIYDGTNMAPTTITGGQISTLTTDTTKNPAAIGASKVNDWFVWNDSGTIRLSHGPDWTNDTTRSAGTALVIVNGIRLNNASITNGPAASRGTYVGTTRSNASSQLDWIVGTAASGGGAAFLNVWNMYNRVNVAAQVQDTTASWTYSGVFRSANGSNSNRVSYVMGLAEDYSSAEYSVTQEGTSAVFGAAGVGYDATNNASGAFSDAYSGAASLRSSVGGKYAVLDVGYHFMQAIEYGGGSTIFYGFKTSPQVTSMALTWQGRM